MDEPRIRFGDKMFAYGHLINEESVQGEYNTVRGYTTVGGYKVWAEQSIDPNSCVAGFVVDFLAMESFASETSFFSEVVDVTDSLSKKPPLPYGTKVWMPIL